MFAGFAYFMRLAFLQCMLSTFNIFPEYKPIDCEGNKAWPTVQDLRSDLLLGAFLTDLSNDYDMAKIYRKEVKTEEKIHKL